MLFFIPFRFKISSVELIYTYIVLAAVKHQVLTGYATTFLLAVFEFPKIVLEGTMGHVKRLGHVNLCFEVFVQHSLKKICNKTQVEVCHLPSSYIVTHLSVVEQMKSFSY